MAIAGIGSAWGMYNPTSNATKTTKTGDEVEFSKGVLSCVSAGGQKTMLCSDALMSYASPQTGESVNIYQADNYSEDNPIYLIKGLDAGGNAFKQEIDASKINPNNCSYNELMVLNIETGHTSPSDYLHAVAVRDKSGTDSYFDTANYMDFAKVVMNDMKAMGNWDSYLSYDKWIQSILDYGNRAKLQSDNLQGIKDKDDGTDTNIVVKPDGSKVLVVTMKIGGMESEMSIKLSESTDFAPNGENKQPELQNEETINDNAGNAE